LVAAFSVGWGSSDADPARAAPILTEIEAATAQHLAEILAIAGTPAGYLLQYSTPDLKSNFDSLDAVASADADPLVRLIAAMHRLDAIMILENSSLYKYDFPQRTDDVQWSGNAQAAGAWLRIPCRTLLGREEAFRRAYRILGHLAGPALDCPAPAGKQSDVDALIRFARDPGGEADAVARRSEPKPVPPPPVETPSAVPDGDWDHETATDFMIIDPGRAELVLARAATPGEKVDYALFLFAFHDASAERDNTIRLLLPPIDPADQKATGMDIPGPFDGSIDNLIGHLRWDSERGTTRR
jgi:hypothetical protein